jgi:hypothetical protein
MGNMEMNVPKLEAQRQQIADLTSRLQHDQPTNPSQSPQRKRSKSDNNAQAPPPSSRPDGTSDQEEDADENSHHVSA